MITREDLTRVLRSLREEERWDIWEAVADPAFQPAVEGTRANRLWWTEKQDGAFGADGVLRRPLCLRFEGDWVSLQLHFAQHELTVRILGREHDAPADARLMLLDPRAREQDCDLRRLLRAFRALRAQQVVALPRAGWTQSDGWSDVAGAQRHPNQTAVFWHAQGQERLSETGMLDPELCLYWRGDRVRIADPLRAEGLTVALPRSRDTAITVSSTHPAPEIAGLADIDPDPPLPPPDPLGLLGTPIGRLWWTPAGHLLVATRFSEGEAPEFPLQWLSPQRERLAGARGESLVATCGAVVCLPDGRILSCWRDYEGGSMLRILEHAEPGPGVEIIRLNQSHPADFEQVALGPAGLLIATPTGLCTRLIGPPNTPERRRAEGVVVRRATPRPPSAWQEIDRQTLPNGDAYALIAASGAWVARVCNGGTEVLVAEGPRILHRLDLLDGHTGARGVHGLVVLDEGRQLGVLSRIWRDGQTQFALQVWELATGRHLELLPGVTAVAEHGGRRHLGDVSGRVNGVKVFARGAVSALAAGPAGVAAGSDRGELRILDASLGDETRG